MEEILEPLSVFSADETVFEDSAAFMAPESGEFSKSLGEGWEGGREEEEEREGGRKGV